MVHPHIPVPTTPHQSVGAVERVDASRVAAAFPTRSRGRLTDMIHMVWPMADIWLIWLDVYAS